MIYEPKLIKLSDKYNTVIDANRIVSVSCYDGDEYSYYIEVTLETDAQYRLCEETITERDKIHQNILFLWGSPPRRDCIVDIREG